MQLSPSPEAALFERSANSMNSRSRAARRSGPVSQAPVDRDGRSEGRLEQLDVVAWGRGPARRTGPGASRARRGDRRTARERAPRCPARSAAARPAEAAARNARRLEELAGAVGDEVDHPDRAARPAHPRARRQRPGDPGRTSPQREGDDVEVVVTERRGTSASASTHSSSTPRAAASRRPASKFSG